MVNINLWIADSLEHGKSSTTAFDFGLMLSPACSDGQDDGKAGDTAQGDEKSEDLKGRRFDSRFYQGNIPLLPLQNR